MSNMSSNSNSNLIWACQVTWLVCSFLDLLHLDKIILEIAYEIFYNFPLKNTDTFSNLLT